MDTSVHRHVASSLPMFRTTSSSLPLTANPVSPVHYGGRGSCRAERRSASNGVSSAAPVLRRQVLVDVGAAVAATLATALQPALTRAEVIPEEAAVAEDLSSSTAPRLSIFDNEADQYSLLVPADWAKGDGSVGTRRLVAFHPSDTTQTNVSVLITTLGADFTSLGSFGTAAAFGEALVNGLDRSYLRKPGQKAVLIDTKSAKDMYFVEYTIQKPGEDKIHLLSAVAVHFNGIYNQLFTLTAQYLEDDAGQYESTIRKIVDSFKIKR